MNKYRAKKVVLPDGEKFDSRREHARYEELLMLQRQKSISNLRRQVEYVLIPAQRDENGKAVRAVKYVADFVYDMGGKQIVEDSKGFKTKDYILKSKLMLQVHGVTIKETK